ncbi:flagellar motor switch phosphatase FliY [Peptostreptococcaceae bacterium AGR-M142]
MMNDMLSQEEIDALLTGDSSSDESEETNEMLNDMEKDALGEIGNINMGTSATTLSTLLGKKVNITTPVVDSVTLNELADQYPIPFVAVQVGYSEGLTGTNVLILKEDDVKVITSLMMGGDGRENLPGELEEIHLSAISEAMNQMVGSSSTSLSEMLTKKIDISPPEVFKMNLSGSNVDLSGIDSDDKLIRISFKMTIEDLIDSNIMQLLPIDFAKSLVDNMLYGGSESSSSDVADEIVETKVEPQPAAQKEVEPQMPPQPQMQQPQMQQPQMQPQMQQPQQNYYQPQMQQPVNVQPVEFQSFDPTANIMANMSENIELIRDVNLKVTVQLGRTRRSIDEILDFAPGTIIELDKLVGEPLDILVNGKNIAKGEVVVIDESYGVRITDIVKPEKRLKSI